MFDLPPEIPSEKFDEKIAALENDATKMGLYLKGHKLVDSRHPSFGSDIEDLGEPPSYRLLAVFEVGDQAFTTRVQDPEQDAMDLEVKKMERAYIDSEVERIKRLHQKKDEQE